jgi:hypothetical protein
MCSVSDTVYVDGPGVQLSPVAWPRHTWDISPWLPYLLCLPLSLPQALAPATEDQAKELGEEARAHQVGEVILFS